MGFFDSIKSTVSKVVKKVTGVKSTQKVRTISAPKTTTTTKSTTSTSSSTPRGGGGGVISKSAQASRSSSSSSSRSSPSSSSSSRSSPSSSSSSRSSPSSSSSSRSSSRQAPSSSPTGVVVLSDKSGTGVVDVKSGQTVKVGEGIVNTGGGTTGGGTSTKFTVPTVTSGGATRVVSNTGLKALNTTVQKASIQQTKPSAPVTTKTLTIPIFPKNIFAPQTKALTDTFTRSTTAVIDTVAPITPFLRGIDKAKTDQEKLGTLEFIKQTGLSAGRTIKNNPKRVATNVALGTAFALSSRFVPPAVTKNILSPVGKTVGTLFCC